MFRILEIFWLVLFGAALVLAGLFATETSSKTMWPCLWVLTVVSIGGVISLHRGLIGRLNPWCVVAGIAFTAYFVLRGFFSDVRWLARQDIIFCLGGFIVWSMTAARFERAGQRLAIIGTLMALAALNVGIGLYQRFGQDPAWNILRWFDFQSIFNLEKPFQVAKSKDHAVTGLFWNHNHFCGFLTLTAFPPLFLAMFGQLHRLPRLICWGSFLLSAAGLVLSGSRTAMFAGAVGIAVAILLTIFVRRQRRKRSIRTPWLSLGAVLAVAAVGAFAGFKVLKARFPEGEVLKNLNGRDAFWELAFETWADYPLLGAGGRAFEYEERRRHGMSRQWYSWSGSNVDVKFAHNDFLQILADYGLAGLLFTGFLVLSHGGNALRFLHRDSRASPEGSFFGDSRGPLALGTLTGLASFSVLCLADFNLHIGFNVLVCAAFFGFLANPGAAEFRSQAADEVEDEGENPGFRTRFPRMALAGVAAVCAVWLTWNSLNSWFAGDWHAWIGQRVSERQVEAADENFTDENFADGNRLLQRAVTADPDNAEAWFWQGYNYAALGDLAMFKENSAQERSHRERALAYFLEAIQRYPQHPLYNAYAAYCEYKLKDRYYDSIRHIQAATTWGESNLDVQRIAAEIYFRSARRFDLAYWYYRNLMFRSLNRTMSEEASKMAAKSEEFEKRQLAGEIPPRRSLEPPPRSAR